MKVINLCAGFGDVALYKLMLLITHLRGTSLMTIARLPGKRGNKNAFVIAHRSEMIAPRHLADKSHTGTSQYRWLKVV